MIELTEVHKEYRTPGHLTGRRVQALRGVTLEARAGEALGLIGLNGAGKSTLLRILLGYVRPTAGTARIAGAEPRAYAESAGIAYVPERVAVPPAWTVRRALTAYAMLADLGSDAEERVERAIARLGLRPLAERRVGALSKGNVQRVGIAQAIVADRALMVLDEPTDGLDPLWVAELREIVGEWRAADPTRTLVIASHNLAEVERLAERVLVLHDGTVRDELLVEGNVGELEGRFLEMTRGWEVAR